MSDGRLLPMLHAIQAEERCLSEDALRRVARELGLPLAEVAGVAAYYPAFRTHPAGRHTVQLCLGTACYVQGGELLEDTLRRRLGIPPDGDTDPAGEYTLQKVACIGCCSQAPVVQIEDRIYGHLRGELVEHVIADFEGHRGSKNGATLRPPPAAEAQGELWVGLDSCCTARGSRRVAAALQQAIETVGVTVRIKHTSCAGICAQTPLVEVRLPGEEPVRYCQVVPAECLDIVRRHFRPAGRIRRLADRLRRGLETLLTDEQPAPFALPTARARDAAVEEFRRSQTPICTEGSGRSGPLDLAEYRAGGGLAGLQRACALDPERIVEVIEQSGLRGRGGGGFPTGRKWRLVAQAPVSEKYLICNGDEGDPGAFMDRMLLESYPLRVLEGLFIAARAVGAVRAIFYIRAEYPLAVQQVRRAIELVRGAGLPGFELELELFEGAGAFVCGEETALIASLEGRRGVPRPRPPYPAEQGLWGAPTLVNNVETLACVPWILRHGAAAFAALGTPASTGTKVFSLTGQVRRGGLIEVPMGTTIRHIVEQIGGGCPGGWKAVQIGGPSGGCLPESLGDLPVDYEALREAGAIVGSGGLVVLDRSACMVDIARYFLAFTQDQSCGRCTPCRTGTRRMLDLLEKLCAGTARAEDLSRLEELCRLVGTASLCGLGQTAPGPVRTTLRYFREEYEAHLAGRCPAGKCKALVRYRIGEGCIGCTRCAQACPTDAIELRPWEPHAIDVSRCIRCDLCRQVCPVEVVEVTSP